MGTKKDNNSADKYLKINKDILCVINSINKNSTKEKKNHIIENWK